MKRLILFIVIFVAVVALAQNTVRRGLRVQKEVSQTEAAVAFDTVSPVGKHAVDIKGYDKPLRSRRETFFVTNTGNRPLSRIAVTLTYTDSKGRQLHTASHNLAAVIPAGETRQVGLRSWDVQQAFYYTRSEVPVRASQATPFDVAIAVDTLFYVL